MVDTMYIYIKIIDSYNLQHQQFTLNAIKFLLSNRFPFTTESLSSLNSSPCLHLVNKAKDCI